MDVAKAKFGTFSQIKRLIPLLVLIVILFAGWFVTPHQIENRWDVCWFKFIFHTDCPGCGMTRAFLSLARGDLIEAIKYNPASPLVYLFFFLLFIQQLVRLKNKTFSLTIPSIWVKIFSSILVLVLFGQWVLKLLLM